jgi:hypothetical protein
MADAWPNTFVVGTAKAGTTSMHRYLDRHPDVFMSDVKEPHYFTRTVDLDESDPDEARREYLNLFADEAKHPIRGEASTSYLFHPPAAERIHERAPDANIIVMLRNPVQRAFSAFLFQERKSARFDDFVDSVLRDIGRYEITPAEDRLEAYFEGDLMLFAHHGLYAEGVERYVDRFGRDNVHAVVLGRLKEDAEAELERVAEFLDVDPGPLVDHEARSHNVYKGPPNRFAKFLQTDPRVKKLARVLMPLEVREWIGNNVLIRPGDKPELSDEAHRTLAPFFEDDVARLEDVLGESLPGLDPWPDPAPQASA